jgi:hypothetical protein
MLFFPGGSLRAAEPSGKAKPVLLYSRHYNAVGETRYRPEGNYKEVLSRLREHFEVRVNDKPLTADNLAGVKVLLIVNPSDKAVGTNPPPPHFRAKDSDVISAFVQKGGGFIIMGNQEDHNLEVEQTNELLRRFGMEFVSRYTDIKKLVLPPGTPFVGGLRWAYYSGNSVQIHNGHPAKPRALVLNDTAQKPIKGQRDEDGVLLGMAEPGDGRVVVITDSGWVTDEVLSGKGIGGVAITEQDNWEIFRRLAFWAARLPLYSMPRPTVRSDG